MVKTWALDQLVEGLSLTLGMVIIYFKIRSHNTNTCTYKYDGNNRNNDYRIYNIVINNSYRSHLGTIWEKVKWKVNVI